MNHHENHKQHESYEMDECCGGGCCGTDTKMEAAYRVSYILQWIFLGGAFVCSLLTLLFLPKIVRKEIIAEQALKAWGVENYLRLNKEIYDTPEYKEITRQNIDMLIEQQKAQMQMYQQQLEAEAANPSGDETGMELWTGAEEEMMPIDTPAATGN